MRKLSLEDIEFIKILATSDASILQIGMNESTKQRLDVQIGSILQEYYLENTVKDGTDWNDELEKNGLTEDHIKSAIACARRLGINIS
jgi:hypothetical protein